jgi:hypothetical protein
MRRRPPDELIYYLDANLDGPALVATLRAGGWPARRIAITLRRMRVTMSGSPRSPLAAGHRHRDFAIQRRPNERGERAGKPFTRAGKTQVKAENAGEHAGQTTCVKRGRPTVPAQQSHSPGNETHVDHIIPKSRPSRIWVMRSSGYREDA